MKFLNTLCAITIMLQKSEIVRAEQEDDEEVSEYTLDVALYECSLQEWSNAAANQFRSAVATALNAYCAANTSACNLRSFNKDWPFIPSLVRFADTYPRMDVALVLIRFYVLYPVLSLVLERDGKPALRKTTLSGRNTFSKLYRNNISDASGWTIIYASKHPKYDEVTEFMNVALIPIGVGLVVLLLLLIKLIAWASESGQYLCVPPPKMPQRLFQGDGTSGSSSSSQQQLASEDEVDQQQDVRPLTPKYHRRSSVAVDAASRLQPSPSISYAPPPPFMLHRPSTASAAMMALDSLGSAYNLQVPLAEQQGRRPQKSTQEKHMMAMAKKQYADPHFVKRRSPRSSKKESGRRGAFMPLQAFAKGRGGGRGGGTSSSRVEMRL